MFKIMQKGLIRSLPRLVSDDVLTEGDFDQICRELSVTPFRARKVGFVAARQATDTTEVSTKWDGEETSNTAQPGDWIVTNLSRSREVLRDRDGNVNTYVIQAEKFPKLYEGVGASNSFGDIYRSKGEVRAVHLRGGFDIQAPWGERQSARAGYLLLNNGDVYGNQTETFRATYEQVKA